MLIRTMHALQAEDRAISIAHDSASAVRMLTKSDGLDFSVSEAWGRAGISAEIWYKHHWEANYVCSGNGRLEDLSTGERWSLEPGVFYCVGPRDRHRLTIEDAADLRIASVFNPPLEGRETHDQDGAYPPTGDIPPGRERMFVKTLEDVRNAGLEIISPDGAVTDARFLIADDRLGFGFSDVRLQAGLAIDRWNKHHWNANLVLEGTLEITDHATDAVHMLEPGALYCVGPKDRHRVAAIADVHLLSVFNPPLTGTETSDAAGSYPAGGPVPRGPAET